MRQKLSHTRTLYSHEFAVRTRLGEARRAVMFTPITLLGTMLLPLSNAASPTPSPEELVYNHVRVIITPPLPPP